MPTWAGESRRNKRQPKGAEKGGGKRGGGNEKHSGSFQANILRESSGGDKSYLVRYDLCPN